MNITVLTCEKCGAKLVIETDDAEYREKKKAALKKTMNIPGVQAISRRV